MTHPLTPREEYEQAKRDFNNMRDDGSLPPTLASGSGDHAELARLAEAAKTAGDPFYSFGDVAEWGEFQKAANPATVLALLAEIAALRFAVEIRDGHINRLIDQGTEAEREATELRAMAEKVAGGSMGQTDKLLAMHTRATEAERKLAEARAVIERLASSEAFDIPRAIDGPLAAELRARMDYARTFLSKEAPDA